MYPNENEHALLVEQQICLNIKMLVNIENLVKKVIILLIDIAYYRGEMKQRKSRNEMVFKNLNTALNFMVSSRNNWNLLSFFWLRSSDRFLSFSTTFVLLSIPYFLSFFFCYLPYYAFNNLSHHTSIIIGVHAGVIFSIRHFMGTDTVGGCWQLRPMESQPKMGARNDNAYIHVDIHKYKAF